MNVLTKEQLESIGGIFDVGKVYNLNYYKVILFDDGFVFLKGPSMLSETEKGKTLEDLENILKELEINSVN